MYLECALRSVHETERHLDRLGLHASGDQALAHLAQSRARRDLAAVLALGVLRTTPENLCGCTSTWPDYAVKVDWVRLLGPDMNFSANNKVSAVVRNSLKWVVRVHKTPVVEWIAVVVVGPEFLR